MKTERQLRAEYRDVLGDGADTELLRLVGQLDDILAYQANETPAELVTAIDRAAQEHARRLAEDRRGRSWFLVAIGLPRRVGAVAASLLVILCLMGAGYAVMPALRQVFEAHTGTGTIISRSLGREMNVARGVDGFTVTVKRVYADPNQIAIGLTVSGPPGRTFNNIAPWGELGDGPAPIARSPILTDSRGRELRGGGGGEQGHVSGGEFAYLMTYDGIGIEDSPKQIDVRLKIGKLTAYERLGENRFRDVTVEGPFTFDLTIPVEPGRVAELGQTVESGGVKVTLERVVTAPTGTRVALRGAGPNADVRLTVDGATYQLHPPDGQATPSRWAADSRWDYVTGTALLDKRGEWTLTVRPGQGVLPQGTVTPGQNVPSRIDPSVTQLAGGPWTFRFVVP